ncbi:MAG: serine/threonine-protein kinase, partial [Polyangiaceae bacterium]
MADEGALLGVVSAYHDGATLGMLARMMTTRREPTATGVAVRVALDLLEAVAFLHGQNDYVPGGLAPEAIHLGADGHARWLEPHLHGPLGQHPAAADHHDRVAYQAPETLGGAEPTQASDLFSVAVILWELLQKRRLFAGLGMAAIRDKILAVGDDPPDVSGLSPPLADVLAKGLAATPSARFASAGAMRIALTNAVDAAPHADVAAVFEAVMGTHPSIRRIRKAVDENTGERGQERVAPSRAAGPSRQDKITTKPAMRAARDGRLGPSSPAASAAASALPRPPKRKRSALGFASRRPPPKPPARDRGGDPASDEAGSPHPVEGAASNPIPVSLLARSSDAPGSDDSARRRATVPAGPKANLEEIDVPPAAPAPEAVEDPPSSERPRAESVAPADSLPPPGGDEVDQLTQAGPARHVGRCELFVEIAHGGMATVHLGRWLGAGGFVKTVAVKALHRQYARDPEFVRMFLDEARVVARIRHPNVMPIIDLVDDGGDLFIVMEYVHGVTLAHLLRQMKRRGENIPIDIALRIMSGVLHGLHAAHEAKDATGRAMNIIHRDISPENIMVGSDGYARLIDFGIASALGRATVTQDGQVKGKPSYLSPEQVMGESLDRRTDIYAASVVLWQALTGRRLFKAENMAAMSLKIIKEDRPPPSRLREGVTRELDAIVLRGMA